MVESSGATGPDHSGRRATNRAEQARLYGAPLEDVFDELTEAYGVSRGNLARVLGLSAPMLSQLASAHRVKMGNPASVRRLQLLVGLLPEVRAGRRAAVEALRSVEAEEPGQVLTRTTEVTAVQGAAEIRRLLATVASPDEIRDAVALLADRHPEIARILEVYGTGSPDEAAEHFSSALRPRRR